MTWSSKTETETLIGAIERLTALIQGISRLSREDAEKRLASYLASGDMRKEIAGKAVLSNYFEER